mmetsp:Transcript_33434/g.52273  ORF Transcript_33434/g.52273 Transcript_33434/m.52273 type:complete len:879 (-) Transcript_33434:54-2690(-)
MGQDANGNPVYMDKELARANVTTACSAGHSTPTSLLAWCINYLYDFNLGNSDVLQQVLLEVEGISGGDRSYMPNFNDITKNMPYMTKVFKETLRMSPPIPSLIRMVKQDGFLGNFNVKKGESIMISVLGTHTNAAVWPDPFNFNPNRFDQQLPKNGFIPWAAGPRQCIGRELALLIAKSLFFQLLNKYAVQMHPSADVIEHEHLFCFPKGLRCTSTLRLNTPGAVPRTPQAASAAPSPSPAPSASPSAEVMGFGNKVALVQATNSRAGTVTTAYEYFYDALALKNFSVGKQLTLDDYLPTLQAMTQNPNKEKVVLGIFTSTYNGKPPSTTCPGDKFCEWVVAQGKSAASGNAQLASALSGLQFFIFGCGNKMWEETYQQVPKGIVEGLKAMGGTLITEPLYFNAEDDLDDFLDPSLATILNCFSQVFPSSSSSSPSPAPEQLVGFGGSAMWKNMKSTSTGVEFEICEGLPESEVRFVPSATATGEYLFVSTLLDNRNILAPSYPLRTLHIELEMKEGMKYRAGDHLCICPENPRDYVDRVMKYFPNFTPQTVVQWVSFKEKVKKMTLPLNVPMTVQNVLTRLVDLKCVPTKAFLLGLSLLCEKKEDQERLEHVVDTSTSFKEWLKKNEPVQIMDCLDLFPVQPDRFSKLLEILPPLRSRRYSISSSPKNNKLNLCVGVAESKFDGGKVHRGMCGGYLEDLDVKTQPQVFVYFEEAPSEFDLPDDNTPIIMISAGTGYAPFRSFLHERIAREAKGKAYVISGCRSPDLDFIYKDELEESLKKGELTGLFPAFSRCPDVPKTYVQDVIKQKAELIYDLLEKERAHLYVCGCGSTIGKGIQQALHNVYAERAPAGVDGDVFATDKLKGLRSEARYVEDVWG